MFGRLPVPAPSSDPCLGAPTLNSLTATWALTDVCGIGVRFDGNASITGSLGTVWELEWELTWEATPATWTPHAATGTFTYAYETDHGSDGVSLDTAYMTFRARIVKTADGTPCSSWVQSNTASRSVKICA